MGEPTGRANARPMTGSAIPIFFRDNLDGFRKPARFIAGHFLRSDGLVNQQAGHAWAEAFVPDLGWVGFDPANAICTTDAHARVAIGLDYLGAAPVRGTRYGGGMETLSVTVKVDQAGGRQGQSQSQS
jgi:transglutaminase-like putative cysteine protease